jgi:hypothetical protein
MNYTKLTLKFLFVLGALIMAQVACSASTNLMKVIRFKQGCSIIVPNEMRTVDTNNIERVDRFHPDKTYELGSKLTFKPTGATVLYTGVDSRTDPKVFVIFSLLPAEISQADLKAFTPEQTKTLNDAMYVKLTPIFAQVGVKVSRKLDSKLLDGRYLKCFLLAYEFTDETKTPQISLRTYYYTKSATFIVEFLCEKDYYDKNKDVIQMVVESLNTNVDQ